MELIYLPMEESKQLIQSQHHVKRGFYEVNKQLQRNLCTQQFRDMEIKT